MNERQMQEKVKGLRTHFQAKKMTAKLNQIRCKVGQKKDRGKEVKEKRDFHSNSI